MDPRFHPPTGTHNLSPSLMPYFLHLLFGVVVSPVGAAAPTAGGDRRQGWRNGAHHGGAQCREGQPVEQDHDQHGASHPNTTGQGVTGAASRSSSRDRTRVLRSCPWRSASASRRLISAGSTRTDRRASRRGLGLGAGIRATHVRQVTDHDRVFCPMPPCPNCRQFWTGRKLQSLTGF